MNYKEKEILFSAFLQKWESQFKKIPSILKYLSTYPELTKKLHGSEALEMEELKESQLEWVSLVNQFDNPIESLFFKEYWVPIQQNGYDYFIDLSSDSLPLFSTHYFQGEPYRWYKAEITKDLSQFLIDIDNPEFDLENHFNELHDKSWDVVEGFFKERDELGLNGKIDPDPIRKSQIFCENRNSYYIFEENSITFHVVNALIVGLIPYECDIALEYFDAPSCKFENVCGKVKNIKTLIYLIQRIGFISTISYSFKFSSNSAFKAEFKDSTFTIEHRNANLLNSMIDKFDVFAYQ